MPRIVWQNLNLTWLAAGVVILVLGLLVFGYRRSPVRGWRRLAALLCKTSALALLALCLLDPLWTLSMPKKGENEVVVLVDASASLDLAESAGGETRAAQLQAALISGNDDAAWIRALGEDFRLRLMTAGSQTVSVPHFRGLKFDGTRSDFARTLMTLRSGGTNLAAVVVVSDGNATDASAWKAEAKGAPIFTVLTGEKAPKPDLSIDEATVATSPFEDAPVTITARVSGSGKATLQVLGEDKKAVATEKVTLNGNAAQTVRLRVPVAKPGVSFYRLDLKGEGTPEATLANNTRLLAADRGAGFSGDDKRLPGGGRHLPLGHRDLDLVEVSADSKPPVCRVLDYSKYRYEQAQKQKAARKHQQTIVVREIKFRPKIAQHDYDTKVGHVTRFLKHKDKVKITIMFRGREMAHPERGRQLLERIAEDLVELAVVEQHPLQDGRNMTMMLAPSKALLSDLAKAASASNHSPSRLAAAEPNCSPSPRSSNRGTKPRAFRARASSTAAAPPPRIRTTAPGLGRANQSRNGSRGFTGWAPAPLAA